MVDVVVSMSGNCEPSIAKPKGKGSAVPSIREVPEARDRAMCYCHHRH